jgi:predicted acylesterase/phospholipase RssA
MNSHSVSAAPSFPAIAFEGCACRAAFHVGVVEWFAEHGIAPSSVAGASSGALIASAVAINAVGDLRPVWMDLCGSRVWDPRRLLRGRWPFRMSEIVGGVAARYFGDRLLGDTSIPLSIVITQLLRGRFRRRVLTASDRVPMARAVLASCFFPGPYSRMVPIDGRLTVDGAWLGRVPVVEAGAARVIACVSDEAGRLLRGAMWTTTITVPDGIDCRVLSPIAPLPLRAFDFDRGATLDTFDIGRASAEAFAVTNADWIAGVADGKPHGSSFRTGG